MGPDLLAFALVAVIAAAPCIVRRLRPAAGPVPAPAAASRPARPEIQPRSEEAPYAFDNGVYGEAEPEEEP